MYKLVAKAKRPNKLAVIVVTNKKLNNVVFFEEFIRARQIRFSIYSVEVGVLVC